MSDTPGWFTRAIDTTPESHRINVGDTSIHYLAWGERDLPGIVLVHGGAAHAHWWDHIGPSFLPEYRVVALDLSGHGDSDRREDYTLRAWTEEVAAVIDDAGFTSPPVVVGHSMGGFVTIATAAWQTDQIGGAVIIDSPVQAEDPEVARARRTDEFKKAKTYDDPEIPIARFRTIPEQRHYLPYVKEHVARNSLTLLDDGRWGWKFDPTIFSIPPHHTVDIGGDLLPEVSCPVALLRCEYGLVTPDIGDYM
ncbi:MAG TPA: alpha/beta hydrolase, partial [Acidimicrobiaceae bacterium]|nr:alpha/beta hydrolase [Acidimicrobiaceae bacterium]